MTGAVPVLLWLAATGVLMQIEGLGALYAPGAANVADHAAMREGPAGPGNFTSMQAPPAFATPLQRPQLQQLLTRALAQARARAPSLPLLSLELRDIGAQHQAVVNLGYPDTQRLVFDLDSGALITGPAYPGDRPDGRHDAVTPESRYGFYKGLHELSFLGVSGLWLDGAVGLALFGICITGLWLYLQMYAQRRRLRRNGFFWR